MSTFAPVVIFCYRRAEKLRKMLNSLMRCEGFDCSPLIVYCDGPRDVSEVAAVTATRELAKSMLGGHAEYHFSEVNLGLSRSIISGVKDTVDRFGRAIVVEDDLELNPQFLTFMNLALDRYAEVNSVFQVSGHMFDVSKLRDAPSAIFLPFTTSWGWATWKRAWDRFDPQATGWEALRTDRGLRRRFNLGGTFDYATMLLRQMKGQIDSWAVRWYWTVFRANGLVLFPPETLVWNKGFDGSGMHGCGWLRTFSKVRHVSPRVNKIELPDSVVLNHEVFDCVKRVIWRQNGRWIGAAIDRLRWFKTVYLDK